MTDADKFLAAIIAEPDDDLPRLVFADWLEENGDSDRAEFIRLQCLAEREILQDVDRVRVAQLLADNRSRWNIPGIPGSQTFRRGFVEHLHISADDLIAHSNRIATVSPVVGLRLSVAAGRTSALVQIDWLARLQRLEIFNDGMGPRLREWFRPGAFPLLRSLSLRNNRLWSDYVAILAGLAEHLPRLERLDLSGNPIGDEGPAHLAAAPSLAGLRELILASDGIDEEFRIGPTGAAALARPTPFRLRSLVLDNQRIGDTGFAAIAGSSSFRELTYLDVSRNGIGHFNSAWVDALLESRNLDQLRELIFRGNELAAQDIQILRWRALVHGTTIDFRGCRAFSLSLLLKAFRESVYSQQFLLDETAP